MGLFGGVLAIEESVVVLGLVFLHCLQDTRAIKHIVYICSVKHRDKRQKQYETIACISKVVVIQSFLSDVLSGARLRQEPAR